MKGGENKKWSLEVKSKNEELGVGNGFSHH